MGSKINEIITGVYDLDGPSKLYGDTDSIIFSAYPVMKDMAEFKDFDWSKENVTNLYDKIGNLVNESFVGFMQQAFNTPPANGSIIRASRELCGIKGLFITKKRYAILIYDKEGKRKDQDNKPGEIKAMGLDLKRTDTPKPVQEFLQDLLIAVLTGADKTLIIEKINEFKQIFRSRPGWEKGTPKRVNNLTMYQTVKSNNEKAEIFKNNGAKKMIPGHVLASLNWNKLRSLNGDNYSMPIQDGFKVIVCKLKSNPLGLTSVAYPTDELNIPQWFKELPFDHETMEETIIDKKIENLLGVLDWKLLENQKNQTFDSLFEF